MTQTHYFNVNIANSYGLNCAVLLQNLWHWVCENEKKGINFHDGYYWTYNTANEFINIMPYLKKSQIDRAMKILRNEGIIITGNYNTKKYDRTLWYTVTSKGKSILQKGKMDISENANSISHKTEMDFRKNANSISDITEMDTPKNAKSISDITEMDIRKNANSISDITEMDIQKNANSISDITEMDFRKNANSISDITEMDISKNAKSISDITEMDIRKNANSISDTTEMDIPKNANSISDITEMDIQKNANSISDITEMDIPKNANSISDITEMDFPKNRNGFPLHEKPIPNINTNINTDINTDIYTASGTSSRKRCTSAEVKKIISHLNEKLGSAYKATTRSTLTHINARFSEGFTLEDFIKVIDKKCDEWGKDEKMQRFLRPETLFGTKFESYLNAPSKDKKGSEQSTPLILSENARLLYELYKDEEF